MRSEGEYYRTGQEPEGSAGDFRFEDSARSLGIPHENWGNETVREFVSFFNHVQQLQLDLSEAQTRHLRASSVGGLFGAPAETIDQEGQDVGGMNPPLADRYREGELLMRVTMELLADGFKGERAHSSYIKSKLNAAINGLGLEVTDLPRRPKPSF